MIAIPVEEDLEEEDLEEEEMETITQIQKIRIKVNPKDQQSQLQN